jgi:trehalose 6-phosphate phosphatase
MLAPRPPPIIVLGSPRPALRYTAEDRTGNAGPFPTTSRRSEMLVPDTGGSIDRDPTHLSASCLAALSTWCLFLDVDGTLLEYAQTPSSVTVPTGLVAELDQLFAALAGAVALVSGRRVAQLDRLFAPLRLPAAGVHGLERRGANGMLQQTPGDAVRLGAAREALQTLAAAHPGLLLEDKGCALALHIRHAPQLEQLARINAYRIARELGAPYHVLEGYMVFEIKPVVPDKGTAIESFLSEPPFAGRMPVFLGDDITDCTGFEAVTRRGGISIAVGSRVSAPWKLADARAVRQWLGSLLTAGKARR